MSPGVRAAVLAALVVTLVGCGSKQGIEVSVTPRDSALTEPVEIRVTGLHPLERVAISVTASDANSRRFTASGRYRADDQGVVDLRRAAPVGNQPYAGAWTMGLPTSMSAGGASFFWHDDTPYRFAVTVRGGGRTLAGGSFVRRLGEQHVAFHTLTLAHDHLVGTYAYLPGARHTRAVVAIGGSEGGAGSAFLAGELAAAGIPALAVGYFHAPGLPDELKGIPLEYFRRALVWLDRRPEVDPAHVSVLGISRGSEAALLLGVHFPDLVHGVAALVPSSVVNCGVRGAERGGFCVGPAWTLHDKPVAYTRQSANVHPTDVPAAVIPVERIRAPILLACAEADDVWPSCPYARAIAARHGPRNLELHAYPGAGHFLGALIPYEPWELSLDEPTERAREQLWPHVVAFLKRD